MEEMATDKLLIEPKKMEIKATTEMCSSVQTKDCRRCGY